MSRLLLFAAFFCASASASTPLRILFIGNSYTYFPSPGQDVAPDPEHPYLPLILKSMIESLRPGTRVEIVSHTVGGYSFEAHSQDPASTALLPGDYDAIVLQAQSSESFELPRWFTDSGRPDHAKFREIGRKLIGLAKIPHDRIVLFANWAYHPSHEYFQPGFPGLRFEPGSPKQGQFWYGSSWEEATDKIESAFAALAAETGTAYAPVGRAWLRIHQDPNHLVAHDDLYWDARHDSSHPSYRGSYLAACVIYGRIFAEPCTGAAFEKERMRQQEAEYLQRTGDAVNGFSAPFGVSGSRWPRAKPRG